MKKKTILFSFLVIFMITSCCEKDTTPNPMKVQVGDAYQGGYVIRVKTASLPGLIRSDIIEQRIDWYRAVEVCSTYVKDGYDDWYLPEYAEGKAVYFYMPSKITTQFLSFWSFTDGANLSEAYFYPDPKLGSPCTRKTNKCAVIAFRKF
jgi:hypothetical protein